MVIHRRSTQSPFPPKRNLKSWQVLTTYDANNPPLLMKHPSPLPTSDSYFQFYSAPPLPLPSSSVCSSLPLCATVLLPVRASLTSFFPSSSLSLSFFNFLTGCSPCIQVRRLISRPGSYPFSVWLVARCYRLFPRCRAYLSTSGSPRAAPPFHRDHAGNIENSFYAFPLNLIYSVLGEGPALQSSRRFSSLEISLEVSGYRF